MEQKCEPVQCRMATHVFRCCHAPCGALWDHEGDCQPTHAFSCPTLIVPVPVQTDQGEGESFTDELARAYADRRRPTPAPKVSEEEVTRIVAEVEESVGMGHGAWDMVDPREIVRAVLTAAKESTR
jgi:hypothetical protein